MTSTSQADTGSYDFQLQFSDDEPKSVSTTFTLEITNSAPILISTIPKEVVRHNSSKIIDLTSYFRDDENDPMTLSGTYLKNGGGAAVNMGASGLFSVANPLTINFLST